MALRNTYDHQKLRWITKQFDVILPAEYHINAIETGHINDTFRIETLTGNSYLLQRKNHYVFKNVPEMMDNIYRVTTQIRKKQESGNYHIGSQTTIPYRTKKNQQLFHCTDGEFWTLTDYIQGKTYEQITKTSQATLAGMAFGSFIYALSDIPGKPLHKTIPDFHNMLFRYKQLQDAISGDVKNRVKEVNDELAFLHREIKQVMKLHDAVQKGKIRQRVIHNDTKINNILFDDEEAVLAIIDLDTVMPGAVHYDYGDAIRTAANTSDESERNLKNIRFDLKIFKAFTNGYLNELKPILTKPEIKLLPLAPFYMTYIMGMRFLTDYLSGDVYYSIRNADDNLIRAKTQLKLYKEMLQQYQFIESTIFSML